MKKLTKKIILILMVSFLAFPIFAERKTRVDESGNVTVKIIWNSNNSGGPDDTNWAEYPGDIFSELEEVIIYRYFLDKKSYVTEAQVVMFTNEYRERRIVIQENKDKLWEIIYQSMWYRDQDYNLAKTDFDRWALKYDKMILSY